MSFNQARNAFDDAFRSLQGEASVREGAYGQALMQLALGMIELTNGIEAGLAEARQDLSTVEENLKEHVSRES